MKLESLKDTPFIFNTKLQLLLCECGIQVPHDWKTHIQILHKGSLKKIVDQNHRKGIDEIIKDQPQLLVDKKMDAIQGLKIIKGYKCSLCETYSKNPKVIQSHSKKIHSEANTEMCTFQKLFRTSPAFKVIFFFFFFLFSFFSRLFVCLFVCLIYFLFYFFFFFFYFFIFLFFIFYFLFFIFCLLK